MSELGNKLLKAGDDEPRNDNTVNTEYNEDTQHMNEETQAVQGKAEESQKVRI